MRFVNLFVAIALSALWIWFLNAPKGSLPALGKLLDPYNGFWGNAEPVKDVASEFHFPDKISKSIKVDFDGRLVPHVVAQNNHDLYLAQGYIHAYYRLWQMDMQTRAAAGRISEVIGDKAFDFDRKQRRKGMVWAAENSLKAMEANPLTREMLNAYTEGVNLFIQHLQYKDYPLEYKLMGFAPEAWTNLKCALLLKYMADDLTGNVDDIAMTYLRDAMPANELDDLFPDKIKMNQPVIPAGTAFNAPSLGIPSVPQGDLFAHFDTAASNANLKNQKEHPTAFNWDENSKPSSGIGSNNWAIGGKLTSDSAAILCNDPHLGLNLPSIWYEQQLTAPGINCYGVSIPGAPGIIIGFNDSISWGFTNNYRDVKDYYEIKSTDSRLYVFDGKEVPFNERYEKIYIKGKKEPFVDTIRFTIHGPVMYDKTFPEPSGSGKMLAMTWMAHRGTNELLSVYLYNRATDYDTWVNAIQHFECPAQNFAFSDRHGNVAIWGQGRFINKWKDQGKYVMRGDISATLWGDTIPMAENPHVYNPPQGYVASANQNVTDETYPYYYNGDFTEFRSWEINQGLINHFVSYGINAKKVDTTLFLKAFPYNLYSPYYFQLPYEDNMPKEGDLDYNQKLQNSTFSILRLALLNRSMYENRTIIRFPQSEPSVKPEPPGENLLANSKYATFFQIFWSNLYQNIWQDEFQNFPDKLYPSSERTMFLILDDTTSKYYDDVTTANKVETLKDMVTLSYKQAKDSFDVLEKNGGAEWYKVKNTSVTHLAKLPAFSYDHLKTGGWGNTINAMKQNHGPSWRMIVQMNPKAIHAYVVYPGGQSGNPGSKYYADFLDYWVKGKYYEANFISH
ncbi:penicillin acylase family protein [Taibaiella lutea]|uniref:Penicillin acylase family protein n=1 Tax=Taibaiella lutea TaxID=2608001 RepID=A0A5M6CFL7_9BACT|nr:penicillin acylase family protein [Taibaiella lutea]KAA5532712.1 penicillin acylase family protein [Taibaiella lutea]